MHAPTQRHSGVLVVFEGRRRVAWSGPDNGTAAPTALWPTPAQRRGVAEAIERQAPLLVIIEHDTGPVALLPKEVPAVPAGLRHLIEEDEGLPALRVPLLDWLPEPLRERGHAFLAAAEARRSAAPAALLPELITDEDSDQPVRFARRVSSRPLSPCQIGAAIRHLFRQRLTAGAAPRPAVPESMSPGGTR